MLRFTKFYFKPKNNDQFSSLRCSNCNNITCDMKRSCHGLLCLDCSTKSLICFICKDKFQIMKIEDFNEDILNTLFICPWKGCKEEIKYVDSKIHVTSCGYSKVDCPKVESQ